MAVPLRAFWAERKASDINSRAINDYIEKRLGEPKQRGGGTLSNTTVNRDLAVLRKAFNLAKEATPPKVGFVAKFRISDSAGSPPGELGVPFVIGYRTGSRKEEVLSIQLDQVDLKDQKIRLYDTKKHAEGRWLPIYREMIDAIAKQVEATTRDYPDCPWLSHRQGDRIADMRPAWPDACKAADLKGLLFHDLRRSALRNMVRAGIPEKTAMKISGHKTRTIFDRYTIVDNRDIEDAGKKLAEVLKGQV